MANINSGSFPKLLFPGLKNLFELELDRYPDEYVDLFDVVDSDKRYEERVQMTGFGLAPRKPEGESLQYDSAQEGYTSRITNVPYALGFKITREAVRDNQYIELGERYSRWLGRSMKQTKENVCANVYNRAFNSSYTGGDGKELLATDHPSLSGDQSNELNPAADMSEASLEDLTIQIMEATDDRGLRIQLRPTRLITPVELYYEAGRILRSELQSGTANNDINALRAMGVIPEVSVNHYLTDADAFFIRTDMPEGEGMIFQQRDPLEFEQDNSFDTKNLCYSAYERYQPGWASWRGLFGSAGAG
jgi:phage major head subunit gpT-like protein